MQLQALIAVKFLPHSLDKHMKEMIEEDFVESSPSRTQHTSIIVFTNQTKILTFVNINDKQNICSHGRHQNDDTD